MKCRYCEGEIKCGKCASCGALARTKTSFDYERFSHTLLSYRINRGLGMRDAERDIELLVGKIVSPATISRIERGMICNLETILLLCDWMDIDVCNFIQSQGEKSTDAANERLLLMQAAKLIKLAQDTDYS